MNADFQLLIGIAQSEQRGTTVKADFQILIAFAPKRTKNCVFHFYLSRQRRHGGFT